MLNLGDVPANSTLYIPFASYGADGASITMSGFAVTDIECYKNGSVTQRTSDNGIALLDTDGTDFDGLTGLHGFSLDLSDNSDSGFWSVGGQYWIIVSTVTVDLLVVTFIAARFRIVAAEAQAGYPKVDAQYVEGSDATDQIRDAVVDDATRIDASALNTATGTTIPAILDDTDLIDDGTSGLAKIATDVAAILVDTGTTLDNKLNTAQADLDLLTGTDGATLATSQPNYAPLKASDYKSPVAATGTVTVVTSQFELQTDLTQADSFWVDHPLRFRTGDNSGAVRPIRAYDQANGTIYLTNGDGFPSTIQVGDQFDILADHIHSIADIAAETADTIFQQATSGLATPGTVGKAIADSATAAELAKVPKSDSNVTWNATAAAQIQSEAEDALTARGLTAALFAGITSLAQWLGLIAGKQVGNSTARTEIRATGAGSGAYDETTDSQEALRDRGDAAWVTGGGGGPVEVGSLTQAALAQFVTDDTGETAAADGSVAKIAQGAAGSNTVESFTDPALAQMRAAMNGVTFTGGGPVVFSDEDGDEPELHIIIGDDYLDADNRAIPFSFDGTYLPDDLSAATIELLLDPVLSGEAIVVEGTATVPTGDERTIKFDLTSAQSSELVRTATKPGRFEVRITDADGHEITPLELRGKLFCYSRLE